jgi:hypothetical protein
LALALATALVPLAAAAQTDLPLTTATQTAPPRSNLPAPIESSQLRELDAWSVSALSRHDGALAEDLWSRSDPAVLASAFDRLPATFESPAARALAQRVLFSGGDAPSGDATLAARNRFEALGRMGAADQLAVMAAGSGAALGDPAIAQYAAQAELARGRRADACTRGRSATVGETPPPFLMRLRAYCAAATGDRAAADLALELSRGGRAATADDNWYTAAVNAVGGAPPPRPPAARYDNSLSAQLSIAAQFRPAANALASSSTLALTALARNQNTPQPQRAQAAALAYQRGAISASEAREILRATPATVTTGLPAIAVALRQVDSVTSEPAVGEPPSPVPATAIANVLRQAATPSDFYAAAVFFKDDIAALQRAPDRTAALLYARAALATGDAQLSQRIIASARAAGADEAALAPLDAALAALGGARGADGVQAMQRRIDAGASQPRAAARDVAILAALGAQPDGAVQAFMIANPPTGGARADSGAMLALASAVERGAVGETALLAASAIGQGGPAQLDTESLERVIRALRALRLEQDARRFAAEAILAGPPR